MKQFDAIIIGSGQAGNPLAIALAQAGYKTALVERKHAGGSCINFGCTPTKVWVHAAQIAHTCRNAPEFGIGCGEVFVDMAKVRKKKNKIVRQFRDGTREGLEKTKNLTYIQGHARFLEPQTIAVRSRAEEMRTLQAPRIFIDTGTRPAVPRIEGLRDVPYLTDSSILNLKEIPDHLMIVGGGYIGLEYAQMFRRFGSEVTVLEAGKHLISKEDEDVGDAMQEMLEADGIKVLTDATLFKVRRKDEKIFLEFEQDDNQRSISGSHLFFAVGRIPNSDDLGLEGIGLETDEDGYIRVNDRLETNIEGIYALGDVKGGPAFTHISYDDYRIIKTNLLEEGSATIRGRMVPYTMFTDPQLARVGVNEKEAREAGYNVKIARMEMNMVSRALETGADRGFMKAIVDAASNEILGILVVGAEAGEIMSMVQIAMMGRLPYTVLKNAIFAHPLWAESLNKLFSRLE